MQQEELIDPHDCRASAMVELTTLAMVLLLGAEAVALKHGILAFGFAAQSCSANHRGRRMPTRP
jgi:hypothetical protein